MIQEILQKIHMRLSRLLPWLDAALLVFLVMFILSGIKLVPFHGDESTFIWTSRDYDSIVKQGRHGDVVLVPEKTAYSADENLRLSIGSILVFSIGVARDIANTDIGLSNRWNWNYPPDAGELMWAENKERGALPDTMQLILARACSAAMGGLSIVFFFLAAKKLLTSRAAAWTASILIATHGDILVNIRRAMQEGPKFLFVSVTLYIAVFILADLKNGRLRRGLFVALGIASGLTLAAKQDAAPFLVAVYSTLALVPFWEKRPDRVSLSNIACLFAATLLAFASFLALMPIFWGLWLNVVFLTGVSMLAFQMPVLKIGKTSMTLSITGLVLIVGAIFLSPNLWNRFAVPFSGMVHVRGIILNSQMGYLAGYGLPHLDTIDRKAGFLSETVVRSSVMYMEVPTFDIDPINDQIAAYETSPFHGRMGSLYLDALILLFFLMGLWTLARTSTSEDLLMCNLLLVPAVILFLSVPLPWQRYFLILQIPYAFISGEGVRQIWMWGGRFFPFHNGPAQSKEPAPRSGAGSG